MAHNLHCPQSERAFVAAAMETQGVALDTYPATDEHFLDPLSLIIIGIIRDLYGEKKPVDRVSVLQRMGSRMESFGGAANVMEALPDVPGSSAGHFYGILADKVTLRRAAAMMRWGGAEIMREGVDAAQLCAGLAERASSLCAGGDGENVLDATLDAIGIKIERLAGGKGNEGLRTPIASWDEAFGGLLNGQYYALAGRPGNGKTAMMEQMICHIVSDGTPVAVFEKDMSPQKLMERLACRSAGLQFWRFSRGIMHASELDKLRVELRLWRRMPLRLYNPSGLTPERFCAIARRDIRTHGVKAVFLDHVQALRVGKDIREGLTMASREIRATVTETDVPFLVLAHINREGANGMPKPENIKEFDQLYGDVDGMAMLWSEMDEKEEKRPVREINFLVCKNRDGGETQDALIFDGPNLTFRSKRAQ